jgi:hypothetical protein
MVGFDFVELVQTVGYGVFWFSRVAGKLVERFEYGYEAD